jgi:hypothetical protein
MADPSIGESHGPNHDPSTNPGALKAYDSVYRRMTTILGVDPNRSELTAIVNTLGWVPLGRSEKRVKGLLIQKLETARDKIHPILDTAQGVKDLECAYFSVIRRKRMEAPTATQHGSPPPLPPEATVEFYLNRPTSEQRATTSYFEDFAQSELRTIQ